MFKKQKAYRLILLIAIMVILVSNVPSHAEALTKHSTGFYIAYEGNYIFIDIYTFLNHKTESMTMISRTGLDDVIFVTQDGMGSTLADIKDNKDFKPIVELIDLESASEYTDFDPMDIPDPVEFRVIDIY